MILEAWAGFLSRGFLLFPAGIHPRIRIDGGARSPGRWNLRFIALDSLPELAAESTAEVSRFFSVSTPGAEVSVEFGSGVGCLSLYSPEGKERQVLTRYSGRFADVVTIPRAGLLAVEGEDLAWGR
ncbi:hypothetical protein [Streptomyces sp. NPDC050982]|uniref:hypothetical protein n=1 Tax=Streptomyces sp. NPDC050982 TaxID=3154746 RepID=UPI0033F5AD9C